MISDGYQYKGPSQPDYRYVRRPRGGISDPLPVKAGFWANYGPLTLAAVGSLVFFAILIAMLLSASGLDSGSQYYLVSAVLGAAFSAYAPLHYWRRYRAMMRVVDGDDSDDFRTLQSLAWYATSH